MPHYASIGLITLFYTLLATRFPAAENPLRIPKVSEETGKSRIEQRRKTANNTLFYAVLSPTLARSLDSRRYCILPFL